MLPGEIGSRRYNVCSADSAYKLQGSRSERMYKEFDRVKLKDGRIGTVMDHAGPDYVVDVGKSEKDYDTIMVKPEEIEGKAK